MIEKNEKSENDNTNETGVDVINDKRKLMEDTSAKVQEEVRLCFEQLAKVLRTREKQLLHQVQALHNHQLSIVRSNCKLPQAIPSIKVDLSRARDVENSILNFGELVSSDRNGITISDAELYKIEEYTEAHKDHISFDKSIEIDDKHKNIGMNETFDALTDSFDQESFDTSSEANITSENEITVLENHNYSPPSVDIAKKNYSPDISIAKHDNDSSEESKFNFRSDSCENADGSFDRSGQTELNISDQVFGNDEDPSVPETKTCSPVEKFDDSIEENNRISLSNEKKTNLRRSTTSESMVEASENGDATNASKKAQDCDQHPKQIQQWLRQILVETETEPTIHEVEQFAEITKSRFKELQFPLET